MSVAVDWLTPQRAASRELRGVLFDLELTQRMVAQQMGISDQMLSDYMRCARRWPTDFEQRFRDAVAELSK